MGNHDSWMAHIEADMNERREREARDSVDSDSEGRAISWKELAQDYKAQLAERNQRLTVLFLEKEQLILELTERDRADAELLEAWECIQKLAASERTPATRRALERWVAAKAGGNGLPTK